MTNYQSYIDTAVEQFKTLITQQLERELKMEEGATAKDRNAQIGGHKA